MSLSDVLEQHSFAELWNPDVMLVLLLLATFYILAIGPFRDRFPDSAPVHFIQICSFFLALVFIYFVEGSPVALLGHHYLFSAHMTQMGFMYFIVPPFFILGVPHWIWKRMFRSERSKKILRRLTRPLIILPLFAVLLSLYHFPLIFDTIMASHVLHTIAHGILVLTAFLTWWPVLSPIEELSGLKELYKIGYILAASVLILPVCALIIFSNELLFSTYADAPQLFSILPAYDDQQLGGVIMKLAQEAAYIITIIVIIVQWVSKDQSSTRIDPLEPLDEAELTREEKGRMVPSTPEGEKN